MPAIFRTGTERSLPRGDAAAAAEQRKRLAQIAWLLDASIRVPGTNFRIGLDPLIGLFPVLGDILGMLLSSYIVLSAARLGAPRSVVLRMLVNLGIEGVVGAIPLAGDVFDAAWKANQRNVRLLDAWLDRPSPTRRATGLLILLVGLALVALLVLLVAAGVLLAQWIAGAI